MYKYLLRTRFAKDIVCEFLPPKKIQSGLCQRVIVFTPGMPGIPNVWKFARTASANGFWFFALRYRGTWESGGTFLKNEPTADLLDVISGLEHPFTDLWNKQEYKIESDFGAPDIFVVGASFGGPAALLASRDSRIKKVICVSPAVDWCADSPGEPLEWLGRTVRGAFGNGYRFSPEDWAKLGAGDFYNPATKPHKIDGRKVMIIHAKDDTIVLFPPVEKFAQEVGARLVELRRGGHLSGRAVFGWRLKRKIKKFLEI